MNLKGWLLGEGVAHSPGPGLVPNLKSTKWLVILRTLVAIGTAVGCSKFSAKSLDLSDSIGKAFDQAGLKEVKVGEDRDKGIVTLGGQVASKDQKAQAETLAKSLAGAEVVTDQIAVIPEFSTIGTAEVIATSG